MKSIRVFLLVATLATLVLVVFVSAVQGFQSSMKEAERLFDSQLQEQAHFAANLRRDKLSGMTNDYHIAYQLWQPTPGGEPKLLVNSGNIPAAAVTDLAPGFSHANFSGYRWRTYVYYPDYNDLIVVAAARADIRYQLAENIITEAILPVVIGLPLSGLLLWLIVGQGLKPLRELAEQLRHKESRELSAIDLQRTPNELDQVVNSVNSLLERLRGAFDREKRFASDAAHELRTPISVLKLQIHNLEHKYPDHSEELHQLRQGVERMQHLVEQILALYRVTPDQLSANFVAIDLYQLVEAVVADNYSPFEAKRQTIELTANGGDQPFRAMMEGDRFALQTLVINLLSNANKYTPEQGHIHIDVSRQNDQLILSVEDDGPGIAVTERERIFERFHRVGGDRHDSGEPGCGLGLAIVKNIAELHRASIAVGESSFASGVRFTLSFAAHFADKDDQQGEPRA